MHELELQHPLPAIVPAPDPEECHITEHLVYKFIPYAPLPPRSPHQLSFTCNLQLPTGTKDVNMAIKDAFSRLTKRNSMMKTPPSLVTPIKADKANSDANGTAQANGVNGTKPVENEKSETSPRFVIIGAGSRGYAYADAIHGLTNGVVAAVAEPRKFNRESVGQKYIWASEEPKEGQSFNDWTEFIEYENARRKRVEDGEENVPPGVDGAFVCVQDEMHREVVEALAPLGLHIMCEKPLSTNLQSCLAMHKALKANASTNVFSIGHVLRYTPHNLLLRKLIVEDKILGDLNSVVHTEPVGWWHFAHSFVRGNWRNDQTSGPSLLTKSCHDIDFLLWMLCSPEKAGQGEPHLPTTVSSTGGIHFYKKSRKPKAAGDATNCMKCPLGDSGCKFSAKNLYLDGHKISLGAGNKSWPVDIVVNDIEDYGTMDEKKAAMSKALEEDWDESTPASEVSSRNWYGRCVFETDNNVCDDQFVTISFPESIKPAKHVTFHMVANTKKVCQRVSTYYGEEGEIHTDSNTITFENFATGETKVFTPPAATAGHGGGDQGLTGQFVAACDHVKNKGWEADKAQNEFIGCTLDEALRSHAMVFAAEEARRDNKILDWQTWWDANVSKVTDA